MSELTWLTYREAAKRTRSSDHTIRTWRRQGMPMRWRVDETGQRVRVVDEKVLLAWWREKMAASPVHFYKLRKAALDAGREAPPVPDQFKRRPRTEPQTRAVRADDSDNTASETGPTLDDVIAELPEFIGQAEHAALIRAMEETPPACDGLETFTHDLFADPEQTNMMRSICHACPLLELCRTFVIAGKPTAGMWAGMTPAEIRRMPTPDATLAA